MHLVNRRNWKRRVNRPTKWSRLNFCASAGAPFSYIKQPLTSTERFIRLISGTDGRTNRLLRAAQEPVVSQLH